MKKHIFNKVDETIIDTPAGKIVVDLSFKGVSKAYIPSENQQEITSDFLHSIPSPYARALLFNAALFDDNHPAHNTVVSEWKGLMCLLCFANDSSIVRDPVSFSSVSFNTHSNDKFAFALQQQGENLWPEDSVTLIKSIGAPEILLGAFSPYTLVFTAAQPINAANNLGNLVVANRMKDISAELNEIQKAQLVWWLQNCNTYLASMATLWGNNFFPPEDKMLWQDRWKMIRSNDEDTKEFYRIQINSINRLLTQWIEALAVSPAPQGSLFRNFRIPFPYRNCLSAFSSSIRAVSAPMTIYLDQDVLAVNANPFSECITFLSTSDRGEVNALLCEADTGKTCLPPILAGHFVQAGTNFYTIKVFEVSAENVLVILLRGNNVAYHKYFLSKDNSLILPRTTPLLEVWPNFKHDAWKDYYTLLNQSVDDKFSLQFITQPINSFEIGKENALCDFYHSNTAPEKFEMLYDTRSAGLVIPTFKDYIQPRFTLDAVFDFGTTHTILMGKIDGKVSILDFSEIIPLKVFPSNNENEVRVNSSSFIPSFIKAEDGTQINAFSIPENGIPSLLKIFSELHLKGMAHVGIQKAMFEKYNVPFIKSFELLTTLFPSDNLQNADYSIKNNLKWNYTAEDQQNYTNSFILFYFSALACFARKKGFLQVNLKWSFPGSFTEHIFDAYKSQLQTMVGLINNSTGIQINLSFIKESVCVAMNRSFEPRGGSVMTFNVDIGGGSTDIAAFFASNIKFLGSIRFAGGNIVSLLSKEAEFKKFIIGFPPLDDVKLQKYFIALFESSDKTETFINLVFKLCYETLIQQIPFHNNNMGVKKLITLCSYFLGGICFYIGLMARYQKKHGGSKIGTIIINLMGNGSRFRDLISGPADSVTKFLEEAVRTGFTGEFKNDISDTNDKSGKTKTEVIVEITKIDITEIKTKQEVSRGALNGTIPDELLSFNEERGNGELTLMGVKFKGNDNSDVFPADTAEIAKLIIENMDSIDLVISLVNKYAGKNHDVLRISPEKRLRILNETKSAILKPIETISSVKNPPAQESPFIVGMRVLLEKVIWEP